MVEDHQVQDIRPETGCNSREGRSGKVQETQKPEEEKNAAC